MKKSFFLKKNHFRVIWSPDKIGFENNFEEVKLNFKTVNFFRKYILAPETLESQLNNVFVYDKETDNKDETVPYAVRFYPVSKLASKWDHVLLNDEIQKA